MPYMIKIHLKICVPIRKVSTYWNHPAKDFWHARFFLFFVARKMLKNVN